jgi:hypothetical protein
MQFRKATFILSLIGLVLLASPVFAEQQDDFKKDGDFQYIEMNGTIRIMCYEGAGGDVVIPLSIAGKPVTSIGFAAFADTGITGVTIPGSVSLIRDYAFAHCTELSSIDVDPGNTAYCSRDGVLYNKNKTTLITYPAGKSGAFTVPDSVSNIMLWAFYGCVGLTGVTIPISVTTIGEFAFAQCTGLTSVIIPATVTRMLDEAFSDCTALESAYFYGNAPRFGEFVFAGCASGFTVYYLAGKKGFNALKRDYATAVFTDNEFADADNDGIADAIDNCPNTPNGPLLGTCVLGGQCTGKSQCAGSWWNYCRMSQSDRDHDGIGNVCEN